MEEKEPKRPGERKEKNSETREKERTDVGREVALRTLAIPNLPGQDGVEIQNMGVNQLAGEYKDAEELFVKGKKGLLKIYAEEIRQHLSAAKSAGVNLQYLVEDLRGIADEVGNVSGDREIRDTRSTFLRHLESSPAMNANPEIKLAVTAALEALNLYGFSVADTQNARTPEDLRNLAKRATQAQIERWKDPVQREYREIYKSESQLGRLGIVAVVGGIGLLLGLSKLFSKDKDMKVPAMYLGLAAVAAMGEKRLKESASARELRDVTFLTQEPYKSWQKTYEIKGPEWVGIMQKVPKLDDEHLEKIRNGKLTKEDQEKIFKVLLPAGANPTSSVDENLMKLIKDNPGALNFLHARLEKLDADQQKFVSDYVLRGAGQDNLRASLLPIEAPKKTPKKIGGFGSAT